MDFLILTLILILDIFFWIVILSVVVSWLVVFGVLNMRNKWIYKFCMLLDSVTNPLVLRLRKIIPPVGGIDLTPIAIIFGIYLLKHILASFL